jgi:hypothetical protein
MPFHLARPAVTGDGGDRAVAGSPHPLIVLFGDVWTRAPVAAEEPVRSTVTAVGSPLGLHQMSTWPTR